MPKKLAATLATLAASSCTLAQQLPSQPDAPARPTATVEVKATADTVRRNDSASRVIVGHEELVKYGDRSALDALKRVPGVTVADGSVRMRGLGSGYTQVLVDGDRAPAGFSLDSLAPDAIEKIEVIRAATAEYSTQSIAGTINIVLRKTVGKDSGELKLGYGAGPGTRAPGLTLGHSGKRQDFSYTLGAVLNRAERRPSSNETETAFAPGGAALELRTTDRQFDQVFNNLNLNSRLNWALGQGEALTWQAFLNNGRAHGTEDNRTATLLGPAYPYPRLLGAFKGDTDSLRNDLALRKRLWDDATLEAKLGWNTSHTVRSLARWGYDAGALVQQSYDEGNLHDRGISSTGKLLVPLIEGHAFAFGWDAGRGRFGERDLRSEPLSSDAAFNFDNGFEATVDRVALYGQDEWEVRKGWSVYLGARWEGVRIHTAGTGFAPAATRYSVFSPLAQTLWKIPGSKQDQLRLALTRTYRAPPLPRLVATHFYTSFNNEVSPDSVGNPALRPELATGLDAAYEHYFDGGGLVSLSASARAIRDYIRNTVSHDGARWVSQPANHGNAQVRSLALESKLPLKTLGLAVPVEVRGNISRNWSQVDAVPGPGNRLDQQPRWSANLGADYSGARFAAGASFNFVAGGWTRTSAFESRYLGVTRDLEAYALARFDARRQLRFTASNLLAASRLLASRYADANGERVDASEWPAYRTWRLQYEQKFQ
jgi:outer membrane receptor protein involved in Fe transport